MRLPRRRAPGFEEFVAVHGSGLVKLAFVVCGDRERAQDACQEALLRVYERWSRIDDPLAYARRAVVNATHDDGRRARRDDRVQRAVEQIAPRSDHPQEQMLERDALMTALATLPHRQRAVIVLRYGSQLSEAEIASTLDIPIGTVKSRANSAMARLRTVLGAELIMTYSER